MSFDVEDYQDPLVIQAALREQRVAVIGMSANVLRPSHYVGYYLKRHGYEVVPVNPRERAVLDLPCYAALGDVPGAIGVVDVFREPAAVPAIARDAVACGARFLWLQFGVISEEGVRIAVDGGLQVVVDRCLKIEHARHHGRMHVLGFNTGVISAKAR